MSLDENAATSTGETESSEDDVDYEPSEEENVSEPDEGPQKKKKRNK